MEPVHKAQVHFCSHPLGKHSIATPALRKHESLLSLFSVELPNCWNLRAALSWAGGQQPGPTEAMGEVAVLSPKPGRAKHAVCATVLRGGAPWAAFHHQVDASSLPAESAKIRMLAYLSRCTPTGPIRRCQHPVQACTQRTRGHWRAALVSTVSYLQPDGASDPPVLQKAWPASEGHRPRPG